MSDTPGPVPNPSTPTPLPPRLTSAQQLEVLHLLVDRLVSKGVTTRIYLIGGAAAGLGYYPEDVDRRASSDIDSSFTSTAEVEAEATAMAAELGLRPNWFNRAAEKFLPPMGEPAGMPFISKGNVVVSIAPPEFLLAMKLRSSRPGRDDEDLAVLTRLCGISTVTECEAVIDRWYGGEEEIPPRGYRLLEAVLGRYQLERANPPIVLPPAGRLDDEPRAGDEGR